MQRVLSLSTKTDSLRSEVFGWSQEDPRLYVRGKPVGYTSSPRSYTPNTVLEALSDGWQLLGPPDRYEYTNQDGELLVEWSWWLVRNESLLTE